MAIKIAKTLAVIFLTLFSVIGCTSKPQKELRLYTWSEYFEPRLIKAFEQQSGIKVKVDYFSSNEQLLAKLQISEKGKASGYDLILPSDWMVHTMIELELLQSLDHGKLPILSELSKQAFTFFYDTGLKYVVPLTIGTTGLAINTKLFKGIDIKKLSWRDVFENPKIAGQVTLLDDAREVIQSALFIQGKSFANATEADVRAAFDYVKKHKNNIKAFTSETRSVVEADECAICHMYSGDALQVKASKPEIEFVIPKEGATIWTDNFAIPKNAENPDYAYQFINFMLAAENSKTFTERLYYRTPNENSRKILSKEILENPAVFLPKDLERKTVFIPERKDLMLLLDRGWTELKLL